MLNDEEIISRVTHDEEETNEDDDEDFSQEPKPMTSHSEVEITLTKCMELQEEANATQLLLLHKIRSSAAQKARTSKKQKKMTDFFKAQANLYC